MERTRLFSTYARAIWLRVSSVVRLWHRVSCQRRPCTIACEQRLWMSLSSHHIREHSYCHRVSVVPAGHGRLYIYMYISTPEKKGAVGLFSRLFFITFSGKEGEGFSIFWKKIENYFSGQLFSVEKIFRNRKKEYWKICSFAQNRFIFTFLEFPRDFIFIDPNIFKSALW